MPGQYAAQGLPDVLAGEAGARGRGDDRADGLAPLGVRHADDEGLDHAGAVGDDGLFDEAG